MVLRSDVLLVFLAAQQLIEVPGILDPQLDHPSLAVRVAIHEGGVLVERRVHLDHGRSEEHTSELQSLAYLVCRLLLEKKKKMPRLTAHSSTEIPSDRPTRQPHRI